MDYGGVPRVRGPSSQTVCSSYIRIAPFEVYAIHSILLMMLYSTDRVIRNTQRDCGTLHV